VHQVASERVQPARSAQSTLTARGALLLTAWFGLVAGFLDLGANLLNKDVLHATVYYKQGRFFIWSVPLANLAIMTVPGVLG
jgi:hypothetical protein